MSKTADRRARQSLDVSLRLYHEDKHPESLAAGVRAVAWALLYLAHTIARIPDSWDAE